MFIKSPVEKTSLLIWIVMLLGCALPISESELLAIGRDEVICHPDTLPNTIDRLSSRLVGCYNRKIKVPVVDPNSNYETLATLSVFRQLTTRHNSDGSIDYLVTVSGVGGPAKYGLRLHLESTSRSDCQTKITANTMNFAWGRKVGHVKLWLKDPAVGCQSW